MTAFIYNKKTDSRLNRDAGRSLCFFKSLKEQRKTWKMKSLKNGFEFNGYCREIGRPTVPCMLRKAFCEKARRLLALSERLNKS